MVITLESLLLVSVLQVLVPSDDITRETKCILAEFGAAITVLIIENVVHAVIVIFFIRKENAGLLVFFQFIVRNHM